MDKNIKEIQLKSFEIFEQIAKEEICKNKVHQVTKIINKPTDVLFRGQSKASWTLESTLVRDTGIEIFSEEEYHKYLQLIKLKIDVFTKKEWQLPSYINEPYIKNNHRDIFDTPLGYDLIVYLRHFGFPTPLLDWTENFYIASYFAYKDCLNNEDIAIYIYKQSDDSSMQSEENSTVIHLGKYVDTHARHSLQQAQYTMCKSQVVDNSSGEFNLQYYYDSYENYNWNYETYDKKLIQNKCTKYILPSNQKDEIIEMLKKKFINSNMLLQDDNNNIKNEESFIQELKKEFIKKFHKAK